MKHHLSLSIAVVVLIAAMLACNFPQAPVDKTIQIDSVTVQPPSGSSSFVLEVSYTVSQTQLSVIIDRIHCYYVLPDGASMNIGQYSPPKPMAGETTYRQSQTMHFNVTQANGVIQPGVYQASCTTSQDPATVITTTFTVTGEATPTPTQTPTPTPTLTPTLALTRGTITYDEASEQMTDHLDQWGYFPSQHHKWCAPTLTISSDGTIRGTCYSTEDPPQGAYGSWDGGATITGTINGKLVSGVGGSFYFEETLTEEKVSGLGMFTRTTVITSTGSFVSATQAAGTATFTAECNTTIDPGFTSICGDNSNHDYFTGSINWEFNGTGAGLP